MTENSHPIVIAGGGIAGLSAAWALQKRGEAAFLLFEKAAQVGGYCRTLEYAGCRFDLGGHRFYTKKEEVSRVVDEALGEDRMEVDRVSRIYFNGRFVNYPLRAFNALRSLGLGGACRAVADYGAMKVRNLLSDGREDRTFEDWALKRFGRYLYEIYFKVYTEKVWGVPCEELSADFATQRIKGLSFREAVRDAILRKGTNKSLIRRFVYARRGFGQITDGLAAAVTEPNRIMRNHPVVGVHHADGRIVGVEIGTRGGAVLRQPCESLINTMSLTELVECLRPAAPEAVREAARNLRYRDLVILFLVLDVDRVSPDHWVYVPSKEIGLARWHEPKNWSIEMAPPGRTGLVIEYFCQQGDDYWRRDGRRLAEEAAEDLARIGVMRPEQVADFTTVPMPRAYPVYNLGYRAHLKVVQDYLAGFENLYSIGRNATFLYTSSDHYVDMGLKAAENALGHQHDLDAVGREESYAETYGKDEE